MSSDVPGLGLLLFDGLAGMVASERVGVGVGDSNTARRFSGSTADVSQYSNPDPPDRDPSSCGVPISTEPWSREKRRLEANRPVLEVIGLMACEKELRIEFTVPDLERPMLDLGDVGIAKE